MKWTNEYMKKFMHYEKIVNFKTKEYFLWVTDYRYQTKNYPKPFEISDYLEKDKDNLWVCRKGRTGRTLWVYRNGRYESSEVENGLYRINQDTLKLEKIV